MTNITYDQFLKLCERWNFTTTEGYEAICFVANVIYQRYNNYVDYVHEIYHEGNCSEAFKTFIEIYKDNALLLHTLYNNFDNSVFNMLKNIENDK